MGRFQAILYLDATKPEPHDSGYTAHHSVDILPCLKPAGEPHPKAPLPGQTRVSYTAGGFFTN